MFILMALVGLAMFVCYIMVLIRLFKSAGALQGIIGIICGLWTFIWGWMNAAKEGIKNIMMIWTGLMVLYIILGALGGFAALSGMRGTP